MSLSENLKDSELITDEFQAYNLIGKVKHAVINHKVQFADGDTHTIAFGRFSNALGMDSITIIRQDTHRYMLLKRATSITIGVLTACLTSLSMRV